jgi:PAS domain S-box-containing protein
LRGEADRLVDPGPDTRGPVGLVARAPARAVPAQMSRSCRPVPPPADAASPLLRAITHGARAVIVVVDPSRGWFPMSDSFGAVLGYDRHQPPDVALLDLIHEDDRARALEAYTVGCAGRNPDEPVDLRVRTAHGHWRTLEVVVRTFVGEPDVGAVAFFGIDVTRQRETERNVQLERQRLARLVETMRDGLLLLDGDGGIRLANAAAYRLLDVGPAVATWDGLVAALGVDVPLATSHDVVAAREVTLSRDSGDTVLELDFVPVRCGVIVHVRDVTARVAARRGLEERNRALVEATALNNQFVATVAHELRGPLSSVVAFANLLGDASAGALSEDQHLYLDVIDRNGNRLLRLIEDLLLLSRLESRTLPLKPVMTQLPEVLRVAVAERSPAAKAAEVELTLECTPGPELMCDDTRVHQVVDNLLNNAIKFTRAGGTVAVRGRVEGDEWVVEVADSGVGIPAADLPRLFSAFFRGSNVATGTGTHPALPGTGLGLVVSRAIVELHGGTISVASTEGVGTTVTLSLPTRPKGG